ncbi:quinone oxidoreductase-like [Watersipora subatra]|uniref:quinone oxidoreductase-like n=1 Tax=Watersipora subatra TaxID=2589382 RepID=UPI00355C72A5
MVVRSSPLLQRIMNAVQVATFGGPEVCKAVSIPTPSFDSTQVLIKTEYAGINPVDTYIRSGTYARKPKLPYTPGSDCSGTIAAVGKDVTEFKEGDSVFTVRTVTGTCAEYCVADPHLTFPLNTDRLSYQQGACLGVPYFTAYRALIKRAQAKAGESVLIHGASGGVGTISVQLAKHLGLKVFATAGTENGIRIVKESGADFIYNHRTPDYTKQIMADVGDAGLNIIIEMLANVNLQKDLEMVSANGRIVIVGSRGDVNISPRFTMAKECTITGCMLGKSLEEDWREMGDAIAEHQKQSWLKPVVSLAKEYSLSNVDEAHSDIMSSAGASGNLVIKTTQ